MKRKKVITKERETSVVIYISNRIRVNRELNGELFFEIENELTSDLSEAIGMSINLGINEKEFLDIEYNINIKNISPDKALYWLTGGDKEWVTKRHYCKPWSEVYLSFQKEYGVKIVDIIEKSKTIGEVRNGLSKYVNLATLYEFSLKNGYIK